MACRVTEKAAEIMARLLSTVRPRHFDFLKDTDPFQLVTFIQDEQPQAIALILSHLPAPTAAKILAILQPEQRAEVAMRIATMERTPPEVIEGVEAVLKRRVSSILHLPQEGADELDLPSVLDASEGREPGQNDGIGCGPG